MATRTGCPNKANTRKAARKSAAWAWDLAMVIVLSRRTNTFGKHNRDCYNPGQWPMETGDDRRGTHHRLLERRRGRHRVHQGCPEIQARRRSQGMAHLQTAAVRAGGSSL